MAAYLRSRGSLFRSILAHISHFNKLPVGKNILKIDKLALRHGDIGGDKIHKVFDLSFFLLCCIQESLFSNTYLAASVVDFICVVRVYVSAFSYFG
jgi:hypothetical protein